MFERSKLERGNRASRDEFLKQAEEAYKKTLVLDTENLAAHYGLSLVYASLGNEALAAEHRKQHEKFRPDDNARDRAIAIHRRKNAAADHAAQSIVIYPLQRPGAPELPQVPAPNLQARQ